MNSRLSPGRSGVASGIHNTVPSTAYPGAVTGPPWLRRLTGAINPPLTATRWSVTPPVIGTGCRRGVPGAKTFWRRCTASWRSESGERFR